MGAEAGPDSHPLPTLLGAEMQVVLHLHRCHGCPQGRGHERHGGGGRAVFDFFCSFSFVGSCYVCCCFFCCSFFCCCWGGVGILRGGP